MSFLSELVHYDVIMFKLQLSFKLLCAWPTICQLENAQDISLDNIWFCCHRDGNVPVSLIQKYLMRKLDLTTEAEVSESVCSSLKG